MRVWLAGRLIAIVIGFTVLSWTASQALVFMREDGRRLDLILLTKSRALVGTGASNKAYWPASPPSRRGRTR